LKVQNLVSLPALERDNLWLKKPPNFAARKEAIMAKPPIITGVDRQR